MGRELVLAALRCQNEDGHVKRSQRHGALQPEKRRRIERGTTDDHHGDVQRYPAHDQNCEQCDECRPAGACGRPFDDTLQWRRAGAMRRVQAGDRLHRVFDVRRQD